MTRKEIFESAEDDIQNLLVRPPRPLSREERRELRDLVKWVYEYGKKHGYAMKRLMNK